jgi:hypothetical protein
MKRIDIALACASLLLLGVAACGGGGGIGGTGRPDMGTMRVSMTDAPSCGYEQVNVTVEKVRVHRSATAAETDGGWSEVVINPARRVDLLTLTNGVLVELGQTELPAGRYSQLRLVLAENSPAAPLANSVLPEGGVETPLDTPSGQQSGLKLNVGLDVPANRVLDVVIDFDACKSVVKRGNSGRYNLKPVIAVTPLLGDAGLRVVGYVEPAIGLPNTQVSVQSAGVPVKATVPDTNGRFDLYPVPEGSYDLVVAAGGRVTAVMTGVPVTPTAHTIVSSPAVPIALAAAASAPRAISGTVTPASATVRATQALTGGPTIEVAAATVDADTGAFAFSLPVSAAVKTGYVANPVSITWTPDAPATAGKYTVEAALGPTTKTQAIDTNAAVPPLAFVFP